MAHREKCTQSRLHALDALICATQALHFTRARFTPHGSQPRPSARYSRGLCGAPYFEAVRPISSIPRRASCRICGCGRSGEAPRNAGGSGSWGHTVERGNGAPPSRLLLASGEGTGGRPSACLRIMLCADPSPVSSHLPEPTNKVTSLHLGYHRPLGCPARCCKTGVAARPAVQHAPGGHAELERGAP